MIQTLIKLLKPEPQHNSEQKVQDKQVSPGIANAMLPEVYPKEIQDQIDVLSTYEQVDNLETCDLLHLYDSGENCGENNSGYWDSRHFTLWAFNFNLKKKINLGRHDGINMRDGAVVGIIRIFADGSTLVRFAKSVKIGWGQDIDFRGLSA